MLKKILLFSLLLVFNPIRTIEINLFKTNTKINFVKTMVLTGSALIILRSFYELIQLDSKQKGINSHQKKLISRLKKELF